MDTYILKVASAAVICLLAGQSSIVGAISEPELEQRLTDYFNERMYDSCKTVVLTHTGNDVYEGYAEFINGKRSPLRVAVSGRHIDYAFVRPAGPSTVPGQPAGDSIDQLRSELEELEALAIRQEAEIARLEGLCRQAGVDPTPPGAEAMRETRDSPPESPEAASPGTPSTTSDVPALSIRGDLVFTSHLYGQVQKGMTYGEVIEVLGHAGDRISSSYFDGAANEVYVWANPDDSHICVVFQDGAALVKTQFGLPGIAPIREPPTQQDLSSEMERFEDWQLARPLYGQLTWVGLSFGQWLGKVREGLLKKSSGEPAKVDVIEEPEQVTVELTRQDGDAIAHRITLYLRCIAPDGLNLNIPENTEVERVCIPSRMRVNDKDSDSPARTWKAMATLADWQE